METNKQNEHLASTGYYVSNSTVKHWISFTLLFPVGDFTIQNKGVIKIS